MRRPRRGARANPEPNRIPLLAKTGRAELISRTSYHTVFHHRYHIVWITKYRYKVLEGALRERIR
ncbi:MAG: transposase, partial [Methylocella sp.]